MSTNLPGSPHTMSFVAFSCPIGNWWENQCIYHMMKYSAGWESYGEKAPILWESMGTNFQDSPNMKGFVVFSHTLRNCWGNPCISHMLKYILGWKSDGKKRTHTMVKVWVPISQTFPIPWVLLHFPILWKFMGKPTYFSYAKLYHRRESDGKKAPILWVKYDYRFPRLSPYDRFCCIFPYCGKFVGKPMHFPYDDIV